MIIINNNVKKNKDLQCKLSSSECSEWRSLHPGILYPVIKFSFAESLWVEGTTLAHGFNVCLLQAKRNWPWWLKLNPSMLEYKGEEDSTCFLVDNPCSLAHLPNSHGCGTVVLFEPKLRRIFVRLMTSSPLKSHESWSHWSHPGSKRSKRSKYISDISLPVTRRKSFGCAARLTRSKMDCRLQV